MKFKDLKIERNIFLSIVAVCWFGFVFLSLFQVNNFQALNIVGFLALTIIPGLLTLILLPLKDLDFWPQAALVVAFSLLELMVVGLLGNTILHYLGYLQPLEAHFLISELTVLVAVLIFLNVIYKSEEDISLKYFAFVDSLRDFVLAFLPAIFVLMSVGGAIRLNNGANGDLTLIMLGGVTIYLAILLYFSDRVGTNVIPTAIYFISAALLLMTSLRGWYITGHDIQSEYKVFELTKNVSLWNMAVYRDAYNACLSITILPTIFFNLLNFGDQYIYKFLYQLIFPVCPVLVYLIARHWASRRISLLGVIYFIGFPTFFSDMPFLNRQEIAFVFYGLMLWSIFNEKINLKIRRILFMIMGLGVILSHYSTTYTILLVFGLAVFSAPFFRLLLKRLKPKKIFRHSALINGTVDNLFSTPKITISMIVILLIGSFLWTSIITQTGSGVTSAISKTMLAVKDGFGNSNRSIDTHTLLSFRKPDQNAELQSYIASVVNKIRETSEPGKYFPENTYSQYKFVALNPTKLPLTSMGNFLEKIGIKVSFIIPALGQLLAKLTEVLVPLGMLYLIFRKSIMKHISSEVFLIALYCLVFLALTIILPVLSTQYGIFRAMQQSMFIIAPVIVMGSIVIGKLILKIIKPLNKYLSGESIAMMLGIFFFLYSSALMPYIFGANSPALHLSNDGVYYDSYFIHATEISGVEWLARVADTDNTNGVRLAIQTDARSRGKFTSIADIRVDNDIFPGLVRQNGYVFLGPQIVLKQKVTFPYNSDPITYEYPIQFLNDHKNLIYNNGSSEVYR